LSAYFSLRRTAARYSRNYEKSASAYMNDQPGPASTYSIVLVLFARRVVPPSLTSGEDIVLEPTLMLVAPLLLAELVEVRQPAGKWWSLVAVGIPVVQREALLLDIVQQDANRDLAILGACPQKPRRYALK
jgi:hypothetical protein